MKYKIHAIGPQASTATVFAAAGAVDAYKKFLATVQLFNDAAAFDTAGAVDETELRRRAIAEGWTN